MLPCFKTKKAAARFRIINQSIWIEGYRDGIKGLRLLVLVVICV
jgi:hypothetical protein